MGVLGTEKGNGIMQVLRAGALYFVLVFGAGFLLGSIRVLWAVPRFGMRTAELMETPIMLAVSTVAARRIARRAVPRITPFASLRVGVVALGLLLVTEFTLVLWLRGMTIDQYLATRDPVSGTVYFVSLGVFAIMPLLAAQR